uniref:Adenylosuccinate lyase n=1 Tax=Plectus sambesii TaxID=2011161 RepID=A0A914V6J1_9BILA
MAAPQDNWESVRKSRYCRNSPLLDILSEKNKIIIWRTLWIWLAEAEKELGLTQISEDQIAEMKRNVANIDWAFVEQEERRLKHDVMAHNHAFGKVCPNAAGVIHLGATSCFVQDNADLIIQRQSLDHVLRKVAINLDRMATFATANKSVVTVGRTHYQTASLVTVGKRACIWAQELLMAFEQLKTVRDTMRFRGIKGATGTQDSFLTLFAGDHDKVKQLDEAVMKKANFQRKFAISGQTYSRQQDVHLANALATMAAAVKKICLDIRVLQSFGELQEPFEEDQIGSSAMPYKKNPMKSERCCGMARVLMQMPQTALSTLADQGLERTLDDSVCRRITISEGFLDADALLTTLQNIFEGLTVQTERVKQIVDEELPFLAMEKALMFLSEEGVHRQEAHAKIRETALAAKEMQRTKVISIIDILSDPYFEKVRERVVALAADPLNFTGRCQQQVDDFLTQELQPAIQEFMVHNTSHVKLDV